MTFNDYQEACRKTAHWPKAFKYYETFDSGDEIEVPIYLGLGLGGETGEVLEELKKAWRDDAGILTSERRIKILYELGDVLWYVTAIASACNIQLEDVVLANQEKLASRYYKKTVDNTK